MCTHMGEVKCVISERERERERERPLSEFLGFASTIILIIFFCRINIYNVKANYAQKSFHTSFQGKKCKI